MASTLYSQLPLNASNSEIRTLTVHPSDDHEAPINCLLSVASLNDNCDFEALSYVWHEPSLADVAPVAILVNGHEFTPTPNLFSALQHLRLPQKSRKLWVDAICINQEDLDERSAQVPLMARIYTRAQAVTVWLGPSNDDIDTYAKLEPEVAVQFRLFDGSFSIHFEDLSGPTDPILVTEMEKIWLELATKLLKLFHGHFSLVTNEYWSRMWTYQECGLPSTSRSFHCGSNLLTWEQVGYGLVAARCAFVNIWHRCLELQRNRSGGESYMLNERQNCVVSLSAGLDAYLQNHPHPSGSSSIPSDRHSDFAVHLLNTRFRSCRDPLDRFYALYGLVRDLSRLPPVDYTVDVHTVKIQIASCLLLAPIGARLFDMWDYSARKALNAPPDNLWPSWVPDFRTITLPIYAEYAKGVQASRRNKIKSISQSLSTIKIQGKSFGPAKVLAHFNSSAFDDIELFVRGLEQTLSSLAPRTELESFRKSIERLLALLLYPRSITVSLRETLVRYLLNWHSESLDGLAEANTSPEDSMRSNLRLQELSSFDKNRWKHTIFGDQTEAQVMFVTDDLHLGFCNAQMRDGDIVARLGNQEGSCVLRRCETGSPGNPLEETVTMISPSAVVHLPLIWDSETEDNNAWVEDMTVDETEPVVFTIR